VLKVVKDLNHPRQPKAGGFNPPSPPSLEKMFKPPHPKEMEIFNIPSWEWLRFFEKSQAQNASETSWKHVKALANDVIHCLKHV